MTFFWIPGVKGLIFLLFVILFTEVIVFNLNLSSIGSFVNTNAKDVTDKQQEMREKQKKASEEKKLRDKLNREKEKAKKDERAEKEKKRTQKGERRR